MPMKLFLTSDLHLGMKFATYPDGIQDALIEARFKTLENLIQIANDHRCDLFAVAGDLFDRITIAKKDIVRAAQAIGEFQGRLAVVLPGNHDYFVADQTDLWQHFMDHTGNNVLLLSDQRVYPLIRYDLSANLYAGPCHAKHSAENTIGWLKDADIDPDISYHIGITHGSLEGTSPDFDKIYFPLTKSELENSGLDLWLIGHAHQQYPGIPGSKDLFFYAGTPEPDGFDCHHEGKAWILTIDESKKIKCESQSTGTYRFISQKNEVNHQKDIDNLKRKFAIGLYQNILLKIKLTGRLPRESLRNLSDIKKEIEHNVFHLVWDDHQVTQQITTDDIDTMFTTGSFPHQLLQTLAKREEDKEALQIAFELIEKVKR